MTERASRSSAELLREVETRMSEDPAWSEPFDRLMQAIGGIGPLAHGEGTLTCVDVQQALDIVAVDDVAGVDTGRRHPDVLAHLAGCQDCRLTYSLLREALSTVPPEPVRASVPAPDARPADVAASWRRHGGTPARPFPFTIQVASEFIGRALRGPQLQFTRGESTAEAREGERTTLPVADCVATDQGEVFAEVSIHQRVVSPDSLDLVVQLISDWALPSDLQVQLTWADLECLEPIVEGTAQFRDLPISGLAKPETEGAMPPVTMTIALARPD